MMRIAQEAGLSEVTNESVEFMSQALEIYLKNFLSGSYVSCRTDSKSTNPPPIDLRDLYTTIRASPYLLGENAALSKERFLLELS